MSLSWCALHAQEHAGRLRCESMDTLSSEIPTDSLPEAAVIIQISASPQAGTAAMVLPIMRLQVSVSWPLLHDVLAKILHSIWLWPLPITRSAGEFTLISYPGLGVAG